MKENNTQVFLENALLLENLQGGIVYSDYDPPFHLRYATEGMVHLSGYTQEELIQMEQMQLVHPDDVESLSEEVGIQFSKGNTFEVEYRLLRKDGNYVHVLDRAKVVEHEDGQKYIHCLLTDITSIKEMEKELRIEEEKLKIALFQSGTVIFEMNVKTNQITFSENYEQVFQEETPTGDINEMMTCWVHPKDLHLVQNEFQKIVDGEQQCNFESRFKDKQKGYIWVAVYITAVRDEHNEMCAIIGSIQNIDEQHRKMDELMDLSLKDSLTDIYNRNAMEKFVNECQEESGALMILDVDSFKSINDEFGHAYGDTILKQMTQVIADILPENALFGRLGGDEFLIYVTGMNAIEIQSLSKRIVEIVRTITYNNGESASISLGAACKDKIDGCFDALYRQADIALYKSKNDGKDRFYLYQ